MKLVRYGPAGKEKPGLIDADGKLRDLSKKVKDIDGASLAPAELAKLKKLDPKKLPLVKGKPRLGSCVATPPKFVAIGLNYIDHAKETGSPIPEHPILFFKAETCIVGPNDNIMMPKDSQATDWEVELGIVIGRKASNVATKDALRYVAGYCLINDVSERDFQLKHGASQWGKGKGCDTFGPIGPWMVTPDEIKDVQNLDMWLDVNGEKRQRGNTKTMIFGVADLVADISRYMTLLPGDVITTGTPPGVGLGMKPPQIEGGDVVTLGIADLASSARKWSRSKASADTNPCGRASARRDRARGLPAEELVRRSASPPPHRACGGARTPAGTPRRRTRARSAGAQHRVDRGSIRPRGWRSREQLEHRSGNGDADSSQHHQRRQRNARRGR
jgi:2-keto-4-pentenoate hydratase/2-oxohepta-3-ene-1,7-dioic acid hydratase in catechol pathway